jgi:pyruvate/2-oxoglutarate dehydrogenase complex dihydrolipoamide dehydrogenase (E3) component
MQARHYDLIVFGGGNAISTAIQCGPKGMQVALVEKGPLGGTCPRVHPFEIAHRLRRRH